MSDSELREKITELVQGLWADGYAEGSRGENVPPSKKRLNRTEAESALMSLFTEEMVKAQTRGVAWTVGVIDDLHIYRDYDLMPESDKMFKGIKNTIRDRYKFQVGIDPAPKYPVDVTLASLSEQKEKK